MWKVSCARARPVAEGCTPGASSIPLSGLLQFTYADGAPKPKEKFTVVGYDANTEAASGATPRYVAVPSMSCVHPRVTIVA